MKFTSIVSALRAHVPLVVMLACWLVFFAPILFGQALYYLDDLKIFYYPLEHEYARYQQAWQLPQWSSLFGFGQPLLAWGQLGFFTPLHLVLRAVGVPALELLQVSVVSYFLFGLIGFYQWLKMIKLSSIASALGSIIFVFSGFNIGHLNHVNFYVGTMVLPWLLLAISLFVPRPTIVRSLTLAILAAIIVLSANPQVALYCLLIAALYGTVSVASSLYVRRSVLRTAETTRYAAKIVSLTVLAGFIALMISSLALLPLFEFLPHTDRGADLSQEELLDFSYPPSHAITLIAPYFFGDHESYWGAKGFQELAAFTGLGPLILAALASLRWKTFRTARIAGLAFIAVGVVMALGAYSPLYVYLVREHFITTLPIPGRFVVFANIGIALLAAIGLTDVLTARAPTWRRTVAASIASLAIIFLPIALAARGNEHVARELSRLLLSVNVYLVAAVAALTTIGGLSIAQTTPHRRRWTSAVVLVLAATLVLFSYEYNPRTLRTERTVGPFNESLATDARAPEMPPRLYSRAKLLQGFEASQVLKPTAPLSPTFSIIHPFTFLSTDPCISIPLFSTNDTTSTIEVQVVAEPLGEPIARRTLAASDVLSSPEQTVCFALPEDVVDSEMYLHFSSSDESDVNLYAYESPGSPSTYFVRVAQPTPTELAQSQKELTLNLAPAPHDDEATVLLNPHLNVTADTSSAQWLGSLSIRPYREYITTFFGNDKDEILDGDGVHPLERHRSLFDATGITHLIQRLPPSIPDQMPTNGFRIADEYIDAGSLYRLYDNPQTYPRAYMVHRAEFEPAADEARAAMLEESYDPRELVFISGPDPPAEHMLTSPIGESSVTLHTYSATHVEAQVTTSEPGWLVFTDTTTPQWRTLLDEAPVPHYVANTLFKATYVPVGQHTITFQYQSAAVDRAIQLTMVGWGAILLLGGISLSQRISYKRKGNDQKPKR